MADDTRPSFPGKLISAASTNATSVTKHPTRLTALVCGNVNAAVCYLKIYDQTAAPTVGTHVPVWTVPIPGNTAGAGVALPLPQGGLALAKGFAFAITTENTDAGTTGVAANEVTINYAWQRVNG